MMIELEYAGERLQLLAGRAVYWPAEASLIVADLHLGKPAAFRSAGIAVPEATTGADLRRLEALLRATRARRLIILGDLVHAPAGMRPVMMEAMEAWRERHAGLEILLVPGNHDLRCGPPPRAWDIISVDEEWRAGPFLFSHRPGTRGGAVVLAGHLHPAVVLSARIGGSIRSGCFWLGRECAVLPAFGSFTGMSNIRPVRGDRVFAVGAEEVIEVSHAFARGRPRVHRGAGRE
jgi:DNA ligase-associated metallophosphoesterase